ncbi:uncharacterized protein LOC111285885 [Durio zibethinus]|uniref:Uncharacterized protein LOC111285885 n=1 Tax=Durio zibethinus TaxID=66656 RepID=A0A6P5XST3_DURZI|nr:uncharacterized protein LOC111285885 [Durio zibethinus]
MLINSKLNFPSIKIGKLWKRKRVIKLCSRLLYRKKMDLYLKYDLSFKLVEINLLFCQFAFPMGQKKSTSEENSPIILEVEKGTSEHDQMMNCCLAAPSEVERF